MKNLALCLALLGLALALAYGKSNAQTAPGGDAPAVTPAPTPTEEEVVMQKVAKVKADMRVMNVALESYFIDWNAYPASGELKLLTTPIAYVTQLMPDPFDAGGGLFHYWNPNGISQGKGWILWSAGPDGKFDLQTDSIFNFYDPAKAVPSPELADKMYDPTNGTTSAGDLTGMPSPHSFMSH